MPYTFPQRLSYVCGWGFQAKQKDRIVNLVNEERYPDYFLVWMTVTQRIMHLHRRLFKRGVWWGHVQDEKKRLACFEFCRGYSASNPVAGILDSFGAVIFDPDGLGRPHLKLLHAKHGRDSGQWPLAVSNELHETVLTGFARLWRLTYHHFRKYPWLLVPIVDPDSSEELIASCIDSFLALPQDSPFLDPGLGRPLRAMVGDAAQLAKGTRLHNFLSEFFRRVVMTSTFVERIFKDLTAWTDHQGQSIALIAAKHCNVSFDSSVRRWRETEECESCDPEGSTPYTQLTIAQIYCNREAYSDFKYRTFSV